MDYKEIIMICFGVIVIIEAIVIYNINEWRNFHERSSSAILSLWMEETRKKEIEK